jgi:hypothetical protein
LAVEIYARIPLFPRSLIIDVKDVTLKGEALGTYQGNTVKIRRTRWSLVDAAPDEVDRPGNIHMGNSFT